MTVFGEGGLVCILVVHAFADADVDLRQGTGRTAIGDKSGNNLVDSRRNERASILVKLDC